MLHLYQIYFCAMSFRKKLVLQPLSCDRLLIFHVLLLKFELLCLLNHIISLSKPGKQLN